MAASRFDLGAASRFQSRDGGITKGGLVRNGFIEAKGTQGVWSFQRPALGTKATTTFTGSGLGLFLIGTGLFGVTNNGTAQSWSVTL